jgi:hypothetical protein
MNTIWARCRSRSETSSRTGDRSVERGGARASLANSDLTIYDYVGRYTRSQQVF